MVLRWYLDPFGEPVREALLQRDRARALWQTTGVNVVLNAILIPLYGLTGAAIATALGLLMRNGILLRLVYRRLQMNLTVFRVFGAQ